MGWQTIVAVQLQAGNTIINSSGDFIYNPSPGANNLSSSIAPAAGTDQFGNRYLAGPTSYSATLAIQMNAGNVIFYTGSLAGGWTAGAQITTDSLGDLNLLPLTGRQAVTRNNTLDDGSGNMSTSGTLTSGGTFTNNGATAKLNNAASQTVPAGAVSGFPISGSATLTQVITAVNNLYTMLGNIGTHS